MQWYLNTFYGFPLIYCGNSAAQSLTPVNFYGAACNTANQWMAGLSMPHVTVCDSSVFMQYCGEVA